MRLFTHNFLQCHAKKCIASGNNFPLKIHPRPTTHSSIVSPLPTDTSNNGNMKEEDGTSNKDETGEDAKRESEVNVAFMEKQLPKIDWPCLLRALSQVKTQP